MVELIVVRHGESTWNRQRRIQGQKNPGLSPLGQSQARELGESLAKLTIDQVVCSDLRRCRETAALALEGRQIPINYSKRFRERRFGKLEGLTWREAREKHPEIAGSPVVDASKAPHLQIEDRMGEFRDRILDGLARIARRYKDAQRVLLVTHGGVLKLMLAEAEGPGKIFMVPNCALYRFSYSDSTLARLNNELV